MITVKLNKELIQKLKDRVEEIKQSGRSASMTSLIAEGLIWRLGQKEPGER
jgi:metal-responsive CopG/Arc/MetJ family transcriptional regulator